MLVDGPLSEDSPTHARYHYSLAVAGRSTLSDVTNCPSANDSTEPITTSDGTALGTTNEVTATTSIPEGTAANNEPMAFGSHDNPAAPTSSAALLLYNSPPPDRSFHAVTMPDFDVAIRLKMTGLEKSMCETAIETLSHTDC